MSQSEPRPKRASQAFFLGWPLSGLGGVNEVVRNLVREFSENGGLAPIVVEISEPEQAGTRGGSDLPVLNLQLPSPCDSRHPLRALLRMSLHAPKALWQLWSLCNRYDVQVLNPHFIGLEYFMLMLFRRSGLFRGRLVLSFHGADIRGMIQSKGAMRFFSRLLLKGADVLVPCSEGLGREILMLAPECAHKIQPVANGIDIEQTLAGVAHDFLVPTHLKRRKRIVSIGAFEHKKGHDVLLKAFARVRESHGDDVCLIIAGQAKGLAESTRLLVNELGLNNDVLLLHDLPHRVVLSLLLTADIFALSSRWEKGICGEGFAMALLEAGAARKPVVSTLSCGVTELMEDGKSGLLVETERPDLLAAALMKLLDDPDYAAELAGRLHETVKDKFTWKTAYAKYLQFALAPNDSSSLPDTSPDKDLLLSRSSAGTID